MCLFIPTNANSRNKIAGVDYLLVSLWSVPNLQTTELMTQFYNHWINEGLDVREALRMSQKLM